MILTRIYQYVITSYLSSHWTEPREPLERDGIPPTRAIVIATRVSIAYETSVTSTSLPAYESRHQLLIRDKPPRPLSYSRPCRHFAGPAPTTCLLAVNEARDILPTTRHSLSRRITPASHTQEMIRLHHEQKETFFGEMNRVTHDTQQPGFETCRD